MDSNYGYPITSHHSCQSHVDTSETQILLSTLLWLNEIFAYIEIDSLELLKVELNGGLSKLVWFSCPWNKIIFKVPFNSSYSMIP